MCGALGAFGFPPSRAKLPASRAGLMKDRATPAKRLGRLKNPATADNRH